MPTPLAPTRDERLFEIAIEPHLSRLASLARKILGSFDLALDAVQGALVALWKEDSLPRDASGWLVRAVVHRSLHASRTLRRRRRHERGAAAGRREADRRLDPARIVERREFAARVDRALAALPRAQREPLVLCVAEGLDYAEIARRLGIPIGTARSRLFRGRRALCRLLSCEEN